ncbi:MAG: 4Fe-4S binding protein [Campylobacteraceae bacterium]|nr:4Fe-4S binding protein [Campylobacteraceae bacterium]
MPETGNRKSWFLWHKHIVIKNAENCIGCKKCIRVCPNKVFSEKYPIF